MRPVHSRLYCALLMAAISWPVVSQTRPTDLQPIPEPPPPPALLNEPDLEPQVTIRKRGEDRVEEYRMGGRLYMIKVTPPHGTPYYLMDPKGDGGFVRQDIGEKPLAVPMWVIGTF